METFWNDPTLKAPPVNTYKCDGEKIGKILAKCIHYYYYRK